MARSVSLSDDIYFATITELNAKLRAREISAVELARGFGERLEQLGPRYNALALSLREPAIKKAKDIDGDMKRERFRGMLQGIPFGAKDLLSVAKHPTTWGAKPYAAQVFDFDATAIQKLNKSAALLIGKLAMVELAGGGGYRMAAASHTGPGLNPWDPTRWSGGSSSGSAIAVAAGLVPFALGSETSGSILTPAAFCGVTGLRPTYGLVSRHGAMPLSWTMDKIGALCHSAEDCGWVLQSIAGADPNDPASAGKSFYYAPQFSRLMKEVVVGYSPVDFDEWVDPAGKADFLKALQTIKDIGVQIREVTLPDLPYGAVTGTIIASEGSAVFEDFIASGKVNELADPKQIAGLKAGLEIPAKDYIKAMRIRRLIQDEFHKIYADIDILLSPTRLAPASRVDQPLDRPAGNRPTPKTRGLAAVIIGAGNLAGLPAISLPCGFADKLPIAISLVGRPFTENTIISLGKEFQARTDWHRRRPDVKTA